MHAVQRGPSHYAQYLGMSAGVTALIISAQPLLTAIIASRWLHARLAPGQWAGVFIGLAGVALVVWHKIDIREVTAGSLAATLIALCGGTAATLYPRPFAPHADLEAAAGVPFAPTAALPGPASVRGGGLGGAVEVAAGGGDRVPGDLRLDPRRQRAARADAPRGSDPGHQHDVPAADLRGAARARPVSRRAERADPLRHRRNLYRRCHDSVDQAVEIAYFILLNALGHLCFIGSRMTTTLFALKLGASAFTVGALVALFAVV